MISRDLLGAADVTDEQLTGIVADLLGEETVELLDVRVDMVDYHLPAITTAGRWWVSGHAATADDDRPFRMFVKSVQNWSRSPQFEMVASEIREMAAASVPWRTEASVYRAEQQDGEWEEGRERHPERGEDRGEDYASEEVREQTVVVAHGGLLVVPLTSGSTSAAGSGRAEGPYPFGVSARTTRSKEHGNMSSARSSPASAAALPPPTSSRR